MKKLLPFILLVFFAGCGEDDPVSPPSTGTIVISVKSVADTSAVASANVVLFNANSGASITRAFTAGDGSVTFQSVPVGNYYVTISAQGYKDSPQRNISPVPFSVSGGATTSRTFYLDVLVGAFGKIDGTVNPLLPDILITAQAGSTSYHTYTGPDGYYVLYNVDFNTYTLRGIKSGYINPTEPTATISSASPNATVQITLTQVTGANLSGKVTFLAVNNGIVDVSILDRRTHSVVNGLTTIIDTARNYSINNIPNGDYLAWASYKNDGYVMDPDWLFKNPGALNLTINNDTARVLDFSVTGAISLVSPTNPMNEVIPVVADSVIPLLQWTAYPQAKEYIIEVFDVNGNLIWGGFDAAGVIRHPQIPKELNSIRFNFDGSASAELISGNIYQWRIYADDDAAPNVQTLLSGSEDLMGLFIVP
jgi:hypothetical protein